MRVLSIQQPFAHLVTRGVRGHEVRPFATDYRGRIAIHASSTVVPRTIVKQWKEDRDMALRFADQGWLDREDLKALPRSAIIGTVELVGVHLGKKVLHEHTELFAWNWVATRTEAGARDPDAGEHGPPQTKRRPLRVKTPLDQYAWVFADPVEIDPITDVDGQQRLWNLVGELEGVIADREENSRRGRWQPARVSPTRRAKGVRAWQEQWQSEADRFVLDVEQRVRTRREISRIAFKPDVEERVRAEVAGYIGRNRVAKADGDEPQVRVEGQFREMFDGRDVVSAAELELLLRRRLKKESDETYAAVRAERRRLELLELLDRLWGAGSTAADQSKIRKQLEAACDRNMEEEEEDYEYVRRKLYPIGEEKAKRAAARYAARAKFEREAPAREAARRAARTLEEIRAENLIEYYELLWKVGKEEGWRGLWELSKR